MSIHIAYIEKHIVVVAPHEFIIIQSFFDISNIPSCIDTNNSIFGCYITNENFLTGKNKVF